MNLFWQNYSGDYTKNYSWAWQYGYKETAQYIKQNGQNYDQIYITKKYGEPHEFLLFYLQYDPTKYRNDPYLVRYSKSDWYWVDKFDKFLFLNDWEVIEKLKSQNAKGKILLITSPRNYPEGWKLVKTIKFLDNNLAFEILEQ